MVGEGEGGGVGAYKDLMKTFLSPSGLLLGGDFINRRQGRACGARRIGTDKKGAAHINLLLNHDIG